MAEQRALPTDREVRSYMRKLKQFRDSLAPREQRMLDAIVVASYWPQDSAGDTQAYRMLPPHTVYDEDAAAPPFEETPWSRALRNF